MLRGRTPIFEDAPDFLHHSVREVEGSLYAQTSSIHATVSIQYRLVTDRQTDTSPQLIPR